MDGAEALPIRVMVCSNHILYDIILAAESTEIVSLVHARDQHKQKVAKGV